MTLDEVAVCSGSVLLLALFDDLLVVGACQNSRKQNTMKAKSINNWHRTTVQLTIFYDRDIWVWIAVKDLAGVGNPHVQLKSLLKNSHQLKGHRESPQKIKSAIISPETGQEQRLLLWHVARIRHNETISMTVEEGKRSNNLVLLQCSRKVSFRTLPAALRHVFHTNAQQRRQNRNF